MDAEFQDRTEVYPELRRRFAHAYLVGFYTAVVLETGVSKQQKLRFPNRAEYSVLFNRFYPSKGANR